MQDQNPEIITPEAALEQPILPNEQTPKPNESNWITIASMAVFVILSLGAVAFLYNQNQSLKKMIASYQTPAASPSPTPTINPTADWETFKSDLYSMSIMYPKNITSSEAGVAGPLTSTSTIIESFADASTIAEGTDASFDGFTIWATKVADNKNLDTYIANEIKLMQESEFASEKVTQTEIEVGGIKGYAANFSSSIRYHYLPSPDGKTVIVISRTFTNQQFLGVFDQILNTFKFTTPEPTIKPSNSPTPIQ